MKRALGSILAVIYIVSAPLCFMGMTMAVHPTHAPHAMHADHHPGPAAATPIEEIIGHQDMYQATTFAIFYALLVLALITLAILLLTLAQRVSVVRILGIVARARSPGTPKSKDTLLWSLRHIASPPLGYFQA